MLSYGIAIALASMLLITVDAIISKFLLGRINEHAYAVIILSLGILPMLAVQLFTSQHIPINYIAPAAIGGIFLCIGYIFYFRAMVRAQVSSVGIFTNIQTLVIFLFGIFALGELVPQLALAGSLMIFIGSTFGVYEKGMKIDRKLLPAVFANLSWGIYWIIMASTITSGNYITPLLTARAVASAFIFIYYMRYRNSAPGSNAAKTNSQKKNRVRNNLQLPALAALIGIAALVDSGINITFGSVISYALAALGSAMLAIAPMAIAITGWFVFRDRLDRPQLIGLILVVIGALMIAA